MKALNRCEYQQNLKFLGQFKAEFPERMCFMKLMEDDSENICSHSILEIRLDRETDASDCYCVKRGYECIPTSTGAEKDSIIYQILDLSIHTSISGILHFFLLE